MGRTADDAAGRYTGFHLTYKTHFSNPELSARFGRDVAATQEQANRDLLDGTGSRVSQRSSNGSLLALDIGVEG